MIGFLSCTTTKQNYGGKTNQNAAYHAERLHGQFTA